MKYKVSKSKIPNADKGLFAKELIKKGEKIGLAHRDGQPVGKLGHMHNHSEEANMHSVKLGNKRYVYAKRDIQPGEELTTNYRMQPELEQPEDFMRKGGRTRGLVAMPKPSKKGLASKKYSRSLEATNILFAQNSLFKKPKSKRNKIFNPNAKYYQGGGYVDLELDDDEIKQYIDGGYVVEEVDDPSIPTLNQFDNGGSPKSQWIAPAEMYSGRSNVDPTTGLIYKDLGDLDVKAGKKGFKRKVQDFFRKDIGKLTKEAEELGKGVGYIAGVQGDIEPAVYNREGIKKFKSEVKRLKGDFNTELKNAEKKRKQEAKDREDYEQARKKAQSSKDPNAGSKFAREYEEKGWDRFDENVIEGSGPNAQYSAKEARQNWGDPEEWKKFTNMVGNAATAIPLLGAAGAMGSAGAAILENPYVQAGLTAYGLHDATTNTIPEAYKDFKEGRYWEGLGNTALAGLDVIPGVGLAGKGVKLAGKGLGKAATKLDQVIYPTRAYRSEALAGNTGFGEQSDLAKKVFEKGDWATKSPKEAFGYLKGNELPDESTGLLGGQDMKFTEYKIPFWKKDISFDPDVAELKKLQGQKINTNEYIVPSKTALDRFLYPRRSTTIKAVPENVKTELTPTPFAPEGVPLYYPGSMPAGATSNLYASPAYKYIEDQLNAVTGHELPITHQFGSDVYPIQNYVEPQFAPNEGLGKFTRFSSEGKSAKDILKAHQLIPDDFRKGGSTDDYIEEVNDSAIPTLTRAQDGVIVDNLPKPELVQVPRIKINVDPNLDRESNAAIKKSEYKPVAAQYKGIARPAANFIPAEEASDEMIAELKNSGYYPVKTESGDYEVFNNKDISNAIVQKGLSPDEISANLKLGQAPDIKSNFQDVYNYADAVHAKRNKDKIDALINSGKTKDQAFALLASQGEGDVKGLQQLYGNYADAVYQNAVNSYNQFLSKKNEKKKDNNDLKNIEKNIDASIAQQEKKVAEYDAAYQPFFNNFEQDIDWGRSLTPSETTQQVAGTTSAYDINESKKYNYIKAKEEVNAGRPTISYTEAELAKLILKSDSLTPEQKKQFLSDPEKFDSIYKKYAEYKAEPDIIDDKEFGKTSVPKGEFKILENGNASWTKGEQLDINMGQPNYQSGRINMLDKDYIKVLVAALGLPTAATTVQSILATAPVASLPWLTTGNALVAKGFYDVINKHGPNLVNTIEEANSDEQGWTDDRIRSAAYSGTKIGLSGISPLTPLRDIEAFQNLKRGFDLFDSGVHLNKEEEIDPLAHVSFLSSVAGLKGYKKGGSKKNHIETTLSNKEIQDYIKRGYIVEELD